MRNLPTFELQKPNLPKNSISDETFRVYCRRDDAGIEIAIMDSIGDDGWGGGVTAEEVIGTLRDNEKAAVTVRINSPGGLAYDGLQIYNVLANHAGHVTTVNEGLAYSAASIVFMAGDTRKVFEASDFGIHRSSGLAYGNVNQVLAVAEFLRGLDDHIINIYSAATGHDTEKITDWLDGSTNGEMGTMFNGEDALANGFADEMIPNKGRSEESKLAAASASVRAHVMPLAYQARRDMIDTLIGKR